MAKRYVFVRMPYEVFDLYKNIKVRMENDITKVTGRPTTVTMPKVFKAVVSPDINENYIQIGLKNLISMANKKGFKR